MSAHRTLNDLYRAFEAVGPGRLTDPGDAGTITVDMWGQVCPVVTAGAETRTLAQPNRPGILASVVLDTDGGDLTLTVTGGYNNDDDTSITFDDAGDMVVFLSIKEGSSYYWRAIAQEGTNVAVEEGVFDSLSVTSLTVGGSAVVLADMPTTEGAGITGQAGTCEHSVVKVGGLYKTEILIDLAGLESTATDGDIIGDSGGGAAHIGQITAAVNGTIVAGRVTCLEVPATGDDDIAIYSAAEATGAYDGAVGDLTETLLLDHGAWTADQLDSLAAYPAANEYLYLVAKGADTAGTYSTGILLIELWGK